MKLKTTPLNSIHKKFKARMIDFAGWEMPVQYTSIIEEHLAVRNRIGIFDVSHMGQIYVSGNDSVFFLEKITCNYVEDQKIKQVRYNAILNPYGGVKDDVTIFRESEKDFLIIVNASNTNKVFQYLLLEAENYKNLEIFDKSDEFAMIAIQGPKAEEITIKILNEYKHQIENLNYYYFDKIYFHNENILISRTGYTGEDGFEILLNKDLAIQLWSEMINLNAQPCGLGARDSLRLEVMYPLYGHELNEDRTPVESGIGWIVKEKKHYYYGKERLLLQKKNHPENIIVPFILLENGIPREGYKIFKKEQNKFSFTEIGSVQSGLYSPILKKGIGTAFLPYFYKENQQQNEIFIEIRDKKIPIKIHQGPFVKAKTKK